VAWIPLRQHPYFPVKESSSTRKTPPHKLQTLPLVRDLFAPGDRVAIAVSGGADSTALLRALLDLREELGVVLSVLHVEHGIRGDSAKQDAEFVRKLSESHGLTCEIVAVDAPQRGADFKESIEEAARNLRYQVFGSILASGKADKIATAHTADDQAETVLMKLLRGAWTEGLSGISPVLRIDEEGRPLPPEESATAPRSSCIRPLLSVSRAQVETYLRDLGQLWREDETNQSRDYLRNRIRHELLPSLREYNPQIVRILGRVAANAGAEEAHWRKELARWMPQLVMPGEPVRGGGRANRRGVTAVGIDLARLRSLDLGLRRRILRAAAEECGVALDFDATERLLNMIDPGRRTTHGANPPQRLDLGAGIRVVRSARELRLERVEPESSMGTGATAAGPALEYELPIPGFVNAPVFGSRFTASLENGVAESAPARVRAWRPGDRVELSHSRGPKKIKEILERMGVHGSRRLLWPVIVWQQRIIWMRGVQLDLSSGGDADVSSGAAGFAGAIRIEETPLERVDSGAVDSLRLQNETLSLCDREGVKLDS
jgi:tRNA(Ile)-lysidine synthase